ncbi:hypothetical protein [Streptomyces sp. NPDC048172]|uniref:hypothetical protein n=1 Tax=Streptomyces sp. NPDC048172 TaxID=3365505 RepID=UPI00370FE788
MMYVAVLVLPVLAFLLFAMARLEERLFDTSRTEPAPDQRSAPPRHARRARHLRLVRGARAREETRGRDAA